MMCIISLDTTQHEFVYVPKHLQQQLGYACFFVLFLTKSTTGQTTKEVEAEKTMHKRGNSVQEMEG